MEERNNNVAVDTAPVSNRTRRTAAIDVLTRALLSPPIQEEEEGGEITLDTRANGKTIAGAALAARSFLDTTCSVYVLDADTSGNGIIGANSPTNNSIRHNTSPTSAANTLGSSNHKNNNSNNNNNSNVIDNTSNENMPKIFGCWNFLHQAMNEIERFEDEQNHMAATATAVTTASPQQQPAMLAETRLLAEFAVKVSRRSDEIDRQKVATCVENFCGSSTAGGKENANHNNNKNNDLGTTFSDNDSQPQQSNRNPKGRLDDGKADDGATNILAAAAAAATAVVPTTTTTTSNARHDIHVLLPHLVRSNAEIREIVTGRIAAFSFNGGQQQASPLSMVSPSSPTTTPRTAFADPLVVETFCRFLAANAVSNGAERLGRFLNDWIIPAATADVSVSGNTTTTTTTTASNTTDGGKRQRMSPPGGTKRLLTHRLPPYSLACVLYHVAAEAETVLSSHGEKDSEDDDGDGFSSSYSLSSTARTISPLGTIDVLQQLSLPVMANVLLGPVLHDVLQRKQLQRQLKQHRQHLQEQNQAPPPVVLLPEDEHEHDDDMDDRTIAMGLRATLKWCKTTDLSLAQCKHIGSKIQVGRNQTVL